METAEIRRRWLSFFQRHGHTVVPSAPLVYEDPNLLFVNAGMVPFKPYFLGQETPPYRRATSVQKCVRTQDIEEVGKTSRHGTFFQMNGNFAFGDYFKKGAIELAWELVTGSQDEGGLGFDPKDVWVTVLGPGHHPDYPDGDVEAMELWQQVGMPRERIQGRGLKDNYWHMGVPGPGGPCSEIYIDRGPAYGKDGGPDADEDRFLEIWNLVFDTEVIADVVAKDDFRVVEPLPSKNIDTGMGLERVAFLLQGVDNLYEIDEVYPVIAKAEELTGRTYGSSDEDDVRFRVVADHVRSSLMLIGDGVIPGNEGRGYVLRRLLRRAVRSMRLLGMTDPALPHLLPVSMERMSTSYPELRTDFHRISQVAYAEEDAFRRTLASGTTILDAAVAKAKADAAGSTGGTDGAGTGGAPTLAGDEAFALHDTYGFPIDLTLEMAAEQGVAVDEAGFRRLMQEQRERARADAKSKKSAHGDTSAYREIADRLGHAVDFTGYDEVVSEGRVAGLLRDGVSVPAAVTGEEIELVLDRTPFYAEGGGQLADAGRIELGNGAIIEVRDVQKPIGGLIVHKATVVLGEVTAGELAKAEVDIERRRAISRAHTATHMVHKAIREALGDTATQAGSENAPGRFRFDFTSHGAVPPSVLRDVEAEVNAMLLQDLPVRADVMTQSEAVASGAMALFGEKYGDEVRVVSVGDWARELCGGTHAQRSGQLGVVKLLGESSIGSGVRRVEALVGADAYGFLARETAIVGQLLDLLKVRREELPERVSGMVTRLKDAEREIAAAKAAQALAAAGGIVDSAREVGGTRLVTHELADVAADDLRGLVLDVRQRLGNAAPVVVAMTATPSAGGRPVVVVATNESARAAGLRAGDLVRVAAQILGGGGGGKPDLAQGGGQDAGKTGEALTAIERAVAAQGS